MEEFTIRGIDAFLTLRLVEVYDFPSSTCHWGGYDVRAAIHIESGDFQVNSTLFTSTGEVYKLRQELSKGNEQLKTGNQVRFSTYEHNLEFVMSYDIGGRAVVSGRFRTYDPGNELRFEFTTDQTYIQTTIAALNKIVAKYGGMEGIKI